MGGKCLLAQMCCHTLKKKWPRMLKCAPLSKRVWGWIPCRRLACRQEPLPENGLPSVGSTLLTAVLLTCHRFETPSHPSQLLLLLHCGTVEPFRVWIDLGKHSTLPIFSDLGRGKVEKIMCDAINHFAHFPLHLNGQVGKTCNKF